MYNNLHKRQLKQFDYFARKFLLFSGILFVISVLYVQPKILDMRTQIEQLKTEISALEKANSDLRIAIDGAFLERLLKD